MKKVLFVVHEYYPCGSAITNCLNPIIKEMKKQNIKIDVITRKSFDYLKNTEVIDGVNVFRINDYFNIYNNKIKKCNNTIKKIYYKIILKFIWIYKTRVIKNNYGFLNKKRTIKKAEKLFKRNNYDTIISCSYPFSVHEIAYNLKKKYKLVWIAYQFDPHTYNYTLMGNGATEDRLKQEIGALILADKIFLPKENYEENLKTELSILKDKYCPFPFALISQPQVKSKKKNNSKIIFTFTGTLYENIRMPFNMLDFFKNIDFDYEIRLYYITEPILEKKLLEYKKEFDGRLKLFSNKPKRECDIAISESNILLNIGNEIPNQTPSKVYELICSGKPIVNFFSIDSDTSKKVFKKYPLVININKNYDQKVVDKFKKFCIENKNKLLTYEDATKNYETSEEVAYRFIEEVNKCHECK